VAHPHGFRAQVAMKNTLLVAELQCLYGLDENTYPIPFWTRLGSLNALETVHPAAFWKR
jgi:hypothetical protein